jgi:hypothetical protein
MPGDLMQAKHFLERLSAEYSEFRYAQKKGLLKKAETLQEVYDAAVDFGKDVKDKDEEEAERREVFLTAKGGRGRGKNGGHHGNGGRTGGGRSNQHGGGNNSLPPWERFPCAICHKTGHWKNECPQNKKGGGGGGGGENKYLQAAIAGAKSEAAGKGK